MGLDSSQISKPSEADPDELELRAIANQITALAEDSDTESPSSARSRTSATENKKDVDMSSATSVENHEGGGEF